MGNECARHRFERSGMQMGFTVEYVAQGVLGHAQDGGGRGCAAEQSHCGAEQIELGLAVDGNVLCLEAGNGGSSVNSNGAPGQDGGAAGKRSRGSALPLFPIKMKFQGRLEALEDS